MAQGDIQKRASFGGWVWGTRRIWLALCYLGLLLCVLYAATVLRDRIGGAAHDVTFLIIVALWLGGAACWNRFRSRWTRMASRPSELLARGYAEAAERAFQALRLRAQRLPADDPRRATLLAGMADYLLNKGEPRESMATYRAWLQILSDRAGSDPACYMLGLHTFAGVLMRVKDYAGAQAAF